MPPGSRWLLAAATSQYLGGVESVSGLLIPMVRSPTLIDEAKTCVCAGPGFPFSLMSPCSPSLTSGSNAPDATTIRRTQSPVQSFLDIFEALFGPLTNLGT